MIRKSLTFVLIGSLVLSLAGCGTGNGSASTAQPEEIELIDPVGTTVSFEEAARRNLYNVSVFAANVFPHVEEYSAEYSFRFSSYGAYYGESVSKGQELIKADTDYVDEQIKNKKEYIISMEEDYLDYVQEKTEALEEQRQLEDRFQREMQKNEASKPAEYVVDENGDEVENPDYAAWQISYEFNTGCYRIAKNNADILQRDLDKKKTLYEMDLAHEKYLLKTLQKSRSNATVTTQIAGRLVAIESYDRDNNYVMAETPLVAIANDSEKVLRCEYVNKNTIKNAKEYYALIDGKRYEVEYQAISSDEYARLSADGGKVYTTFTLLGGEENVNVGDYAVIVIVNKEFENVLTVPKDALMKDDTGYYVFVYENGRNVYKSVQIGYSDGVYTEIVSGLQEGDKVLYDVQEVNTEKTMTLTRQDYSIDFSAKAKLVYASTMSQYVKIENGTVYFQEFMVERFQHVNKGDVIATVRVEPDNLALRRNETRLTRLRERLADYKEQHKEDSKEEYYIEAVKNYEEQIQDVQDIIAQQKKDFNTKTIVAEKTGVIRSLSRHEKEDILQNGYWLLEIADENTCYVELEDSNQTLQYGNLVNVSFMDATQTSRTITGEVVSMSNMGLSNALKSDYTEVLLPNEEIENVLQSIFSGMFWDEYRYTVTAKVRNMHGVLMVPRSAVYDYGGGKTYVYVKDENGNAKALSFVSGGSNDGYYWVVLGLTEGMEICLK